MNRRSFARGITLASSFFFAHMPWAGPTSAQHGTPAAAIPQLPVTVTDANGNDVTVTDVSRIVPLNGSVTETVFALGLGANVVAVDVSALYPAEALALPKVGYQAELSAEGILSFEPTLAIGTTEAGPENVLQQVADAGIPVVILDHPTDPASAPDEIRNVAAAVGLADQGDKLATSVESRMAEAAELAASSADEPRVAFLYLRGTGVQMISGAGSAADGCIRAAGGINVGAELGIHGYQPITPEALVTAAPDVILVMQGGLESIGGIEALMEIPGVAETPAGMNQRFVAFEDLYLLGFGPRIGDSIYDLTIALHSDIDQEPLHPEWQGLEREGVSTPVSSPAA